MNSFSIPPLIVERFGWVLLHSLWQFALIAVLAAMTIRLLRHNSAALRYVVLGVAMVITVVVPVATWILQPASFPEYPTRQAALESEHERVVENDDTLDRPIETENGSNTTVGLAAGPLSSQPLLATDTTEEDPITGASASNTSAVTPAEVLLTPPPGFQIEPAWSERISTYLRPWLAWIVAGWSVGVLLCSLRPLLGWHTLRRLRRVGVSPVSDDVLDTLKRASERGHAVRR